MKKILLCMLAVVFLAVAGAGHARAQSGGQLRGNIASPQGKISSELAALHQEYQTHLQSGRAAADFRPTTQLVQTVSNRVAIDATATGNPEALKKDLEALGLQNVAVASNLVSGQLPFSTISDLNEVSTLQFARAAYAMTWVGDVDSQGDVSMKSDEARTQFSVDGTGIEVGTLSDSYNCLQGADEDVASGDLPNDVEVVEEFGNCANGSDEGRGMMQLIYDVAPNADLSFHTAFGVGQAGFAQGIRDLRDAGADVINDDVLIFAEPMFQDGPVAQAVDEVVAGGIPYYSSAGNSARDSYESPFRGSGENITVNGFEQELHDFDPEGGVDTRLGFTLDGQSSAIVVLQWDSPFFSVTGNPAAATQNDLDIIVLAGDTAITGSILTNTQSIGGTGDAFEIFEVENTGLGAASADILIGQRTGTGAAPGLLKVAWFSSGGDLVLDEYATNSPTSYGHANAARATAVGAAYYDETPEFGQTPPLLETFSSAGGVPIFFDVAGNRLAAPVVRPKPEITAPDGTDTTFFGSDRDGNGLPNFSGTSAAAPHAAGLAALMKQAVPNATPDGINLALQGTAIDMGPAGFDFDSGFGLIQAPEAIQRLQQEPTSVTLGGYDAAPATMPYALLGSVALLGLVGAAAVWQRTRR